ncbi:MAG: DUF1588 domain-containing protein [Acidobacteriia bacterium]|nr:DUF1588 domain-containing protein [Terriglobia bacterium]
MIRLAILLALAALACFGAPSEDYSFQTAQSFLNTYCQNCHQGQTAVGGFRLGQIAAPSSLRQEAQRWTSLSRRITGGEMPPKGAPAPDFAQREQFTHWLGKALRAEACANGVVPGPAPIRRLNRHEYTATLRDLLDMHLDIGQTLPADGAGGEGFDNAAETLFLSPLHSEKYMEAAQFAMDFAAREYKSRTKILVAAPGASGLTPRQAAQRVLKTFLPRAFRRPVTESEVAPYLALFQAATDQGQSYEEAIFYTLRGALVSPLFLFRAEPPNPGTETRPLESYALASRISYFLWGSMPDELLTDVAASGKLQEPAVLKKLIPTMLRNDRSLEFVERFIEQWLHTRELATDKAPDAGLFAAYTADEELRSDIRNQPVLFLRELLVKNLSLLQLLDSKHTIGTSNLAKHFGLKLPLNPGRTKQPQWIELPEGSNRGGLLGMPAVLAVSSYPYRTSPVLRGAWILESLLGTPSPPPPPDVPALDEAEAAAQAGQPRTTVRERLAVHRASPACAGCHDRMDPLGFALENYDVIGRWRDEESGKPVDNSAELSDGTKFHGPDQLRKVLLDRKDLFMRNLASKMLGYALGRGLTLQDSCTVDQIVAHVRENEYSAQSLVEAIVLSVPFRYQTGRVVEKK